MRKAHCGTQKVRSRRECAALPSGNDRIAKKAEPSSVQDFSGTNPQRPFGPGSFEVREIGLGHTMFASFRALNCKGISYIGFRAGHKAQRVSPQSILV